MVSISVEQKLNSMSLFEKMEWKQKFYQYTKNNKNQFGGFRILNISKNINFCLNYMLGTPFESWDSLLLENKCFIIIKMFKHSTTIVENYLRFLENAIKFQISLK